MDMNNNIFILTVINDILTAIAALVLLELLTEFNFLMIKNEKLELL